jgi:hypothetical protein
MTIALVIVAAAVSSLHIDIGPIHIGFSPLLVCMMLGTIFCNTCPLSHDLMNASDKWTSPLSSICFR